MFGLFGKGPQFTPPINGNHPNGMGGMQMPQGQGGALAQLAAPKMSGMDKLSKLGGMMKDLDWTSGGGHANAAQAEIDQKMQQALIMQQQQKQAALVKQMTGGGQGALAAAAQVNPNAYAGALAKQQLGVHQITGGNSVYNPNTGGFTQAPQNFQHDNLVSTVGNGQGSTYNMGASNADMNDRYKIDTQGQGQQLDFAAAQMQDATTQRGQDVNRYGHDVRAKGNQLGYDADMATVGVNQQNADTSRYEALNPNSKPRTFNGEQSKSAGFASRALAAQKAMQEGGYNPTKGIGFGARIGLKPDELRAYQAQQDEFVNAVLRKESGAAISDQEKENAISMYFPDRKDGEDVVSAKAAIRQRAIDAMIAESQGAYEQMFGGAQGSSPENNDDDGIEAEMRRRGLIP